MWDGNTVSKTIFPSYVIVEREPMWDGNLLQPSTKPVKRSVEREPMWDGNLIDTFYQGEINQLSENQCGMETSICSIRLTSIMC